MSSLGRRFSISGEYLMRLYTEANGAVERNFALGKASSKFENSIIPALVRLRSDIQKLIEKSTRDHPLTTEEQLSAFCRQVNSLIEKCIKSPSRPNKHFTQTLRGVLRAARERLTREQIFDEEESDFLAENPPTHLEDEATQEAVTIIPPELASVPDPYALSPLEELLLEELMRAESEEKNPDKHCEEALEAAAALEKAGESAQTLIVPTESDAPVLGVDHREPEAEIVIQPDVSVQPVQAVDEVEPPKSANADDVPTEADTPEPLPDTFPLDEVAFVIRWIQAGKQTNMDGRKKMREEIRRALPGKDRNKKYITDLVTFVVRYFDRAEAACATMSIAPDEEVALAVEQIAQEEVPVSEELEQVPAVEDQTVVEEVSASPDPEQTYISDTAVTFQKFETNNTATGMRLGTRSRTVSTIDGIIECSEVQWGMKRTSRDFTNESATSTRGDASSSSENVEADALETAIIDEIVKLVSLIPNRLLSFDDIAHIRHEIYAANECLVETRSMIAHIELMTKLASEALVINDLLPELKSKSITMEELIETVRNCAYQGQLVWHHKDLRSIAASYMRLGECDAHSHIAMRMAKGGIKNSVVRIVHPAKTPVSSPAVIGISAEVRGIDPEKREIEREREVAQLQLLELSQREEQLARWSTQLETLQRELAQRRVELDTEKEELAGIRVELDFQREQLDEDRAQLESDLEEWETSKLNGVDELETELNNEGGDDANEDIDHAEEVGRDEGEPSLSDAVIAVKAAAQDTMIVAKKTTVGQAASSAIPTPPPPVASEPPVILHPSTQPSDNGHWKESATEAAAACFSMKKELVVCMNDLDRTREFALDIIETVRNLNAEGCATLHWSAVQASLEQRYTRRKGSPYLNIIAEYLASVTRRSKLIGSIESVAEHHLTSGNVLQDTEMKVLTASKHFCDQLRSDQSAEIDGILYGDVELAETLNGALLSIDVNK